MNVYVAVLFCSSAVYAMTTKHPHTREPNEGEAIMFSYNGVTHDLIVRQTGNNMYNCYIAAVTMEERHKVHTDAGLRSIEIRVLGQLSTATPVDASTVDQHNIRSCGHAPHNGTVHYYTVP